MVPSTELPPVAGYQNWRHLVFLHWRVAPEQLQQHLPEGLVAETFDGSAWLGMVPFAMERVRPWWSPAVPGISWFLETNIRTYVRHQSGLSAVWFFSLDANSRLAVKVARTFWKLNYIDCHLTLNRDPLSSAIHYTGRRVHHPDDRYDIQIELPNEEPEVAAANSIDHFLLERYSLITQTPDGRFLSANVMHEPYPFLPVSSLLCRESYTSRLVDHPDENMPPDHAVYSPGVDVKVSTLQALK